MGLLKKLLPSHRRSESGQDTGARVPPQTTSAPAESDTSGGNGSLCKKCSHVFSAISFRATTDATAQEISFVPTKPWKWSKRDLETGCSMGCIFCPKLQSITQGTSSISLDCVEPGLPRLSKLTENERNVEGYWTFCVSAAGKKSRLSLFPISEAECETCVNYYPEENTGNNASVGLVKKWMDKCLREHAACAKNVSPQVYPTRLLELNGSVIRLINTKDSTVTGPYVCLSHCWGKSPTSLLLTSDNEEMLRQGISQHQLPLTFKEAVNITERLGFTYLWIDSLCIIQAGPGKVTDWTREVRLMASVYSNSILNLAASDSGNSSSGIFRIRSVNRTVPVMMNFPTAITKRDASLRWAVTAPARAHVLITPDILEQSVGHFALDQRAWVCQERLLSPRKAHFSQNQVFWECCETPFACESVPCGFGINHTLVQTRSSVWAIEADGAQEEASSSAGMGSLTSGLLQVYADSKTRATALSSKPATEGDRHLSDLESSPAPLLKTPPVTWKASDAIAQSERWFDTLTDFTCRQLTVPTDKLPAIGAVAQKVGESLGDEYALGCFKSHLPQALLWQYRDGPVDPASDTSYVAPSWSWASTAHPLSFADCYWPTLMRSGEDMKIHFFAELVDIKADLIDADNPFGQVSSGCMLLRAPLMQAAGLELSGGKVTLGADFLASRYQTISFDQKGSHSRVGANVHLLPIAWKTGHGRVGGTPFMREHGLALSRKPDNSYIRVGTFLGTHMSPASKTEEWKYGTQDWGYPEDMMYDVKLV